VGPHPGRLDCAEPFGPSGPAGGCTPNSGQRSFSIDTERDSTAQECEQGPDSEQQSRRERADGAGYQCDDHDT
jgi:hypothetical protein